MLDHVDEQSFLEDEDTWAEDEKIRFNLKELNKAFHDAVPILAATEWHIRKVERGAAEIVMPLNVPSTNQFVAHQAAVILVAADYAGGVALASLFHGIPILGFHKIKKDESCAYLWGAKSSSQWLQPSIDDLVCKATVNKEVWGRAYSRYKKGKRVLETAHIDMFNGDVKVTEADFTYWVADTNVLRNSASDINKIHPLQSHKLQSSAHLISGLRAIEDDKSSDEQLFQDQYSKLAAGKQGIALAQRFVIRSPELQPMVAARTKSLDLLLEAFENAGESYQIVNIGGGLDFRRWRKSIKNCIRYIECDLPSLQKEKKNFLEENSLPMSETDYFVSFDLLKDDIHETLTSRDFYNNDCPSLIWWEGGTMYFSQELTQKIFRSIGKLLNNTHSRFWFDYVAQTLVDDETGYRSVEAFNDNMQKMGEPFINGYDDIQTKISDVGLEVSEVNTAQTVLSKTDPIYGLYSFCTAKVD